MEGASVTPDAVPDAPAEAVTPEAVTRAPAPAAPAPPAAPAATEPRPTTQDLPAALEPELRRIIDTAVARVAAIELEAIREARQLTQRSEQEARDALRFALDRAFNLINSLELMAATVSGMAEALRTELDDAIEALRNVPEPESPLAKELAAQTQTGEQQPAAEPAAATPVAETPVAAEPLAETASPAEPARAAVEEPEPRVRLTPLVRPVETPQLEPAPEPAGEQPAAQGPDGNGSGSPDPEPERELAAVGGDAPAKRRHKGVVRRFFTHG
jgi:hypothetical protein